MVPLKGKKQVRPIVVGRYWSYRSQKTATPKKKKLKKIKS